MTYLTTKNTPSSPVRLCQLLLAFHIFSFACRWVGRKAGTRAVATSLWVWLILFIIDVLLISLAGPNAYNAVMVALSHVTKMPAAYFGGKAAFRDVVRVRQVAVR